MQAPTAELSALVPLHRRPGAGASWLRGRVAAGPIVGRLEAILRQQDMSTVCETSRCPNRGACWGEGTATFQLLGDVCTRGCRFCHTGRGGRPLPLDDTEPERLAEAVSALALGYVVLTSVDRDDLEDGGASHLARCLVTLRLALPAAGLELLMPDFGGDERALATVLEAGADVFAHNLETVERLTPRVRDRRAGYRRSLDVLGAVRVFAPRQLTKSGLMVGLGESDDELKAAMDDLLEAGVSVLTLGQYLPPSPRHWPLARLLPPEGFDALGEEARNRGFRAVAAAPLVRSSYRAADLYRRARLSGG